MATEEGVVFKMGPPGKGTAWVKTTRSSACQSCSHKRDCLGDGEGKDMDMEVEAVNTARAAVGDRIVLSIETTSLLKATFMLYVFPILAMIVGALIGQVVAAARGMDPSGASVLAGCLFFGLAFVLIRVTGRRMAKSDAYKPEIIKIRAHRPPPVNAVAVNPDT